MSFNMCQPEDEEICVVKLLWSHIYGKKHYTNTKLNHSSRTKA